MKNFKIKREESKNEYTQLIEFYAVDEKNKIISGASATLNRYKERGDDDDNGKWEDWKISHCSTHSKTYKEKLPYFEAINEAMKELKKLNN